MAKEIKHAYGDGDLGAFHRHPNRKHHFLLPASCAFYTYIVLYLHSSLAITHDASELGAI
jgi:hypothetical protein